MNATSKIEAATLASAMALAFAEIAGATKGKENPAFKAGGKVSRYADINAVIDAIKPALINHSLFFTQQPQPSTDGITVRTVLHHAGGETLDLGDLFVPANKHDAQGFGSALTYARRYALVTAFGVPVEDDDGNTAVKAGGGQGSSAQSAPAGPITNGQVVKLQSLQKATATNALTFNQYFKISALPSLPADRFVEAERMLNDKLAKLISAETNKEAANA